MSEKHLRFAIFGKEHQAKKSAMIESVLAVLSRRGAVMTIDRPFLEILQSLDIDTQGVAAFDGDDFDADFVISLGGDGTMLKAAARVGAKNIPIVGVNIGRLGFLSDTKPTEMDMVVDALYNGEYKLENHSAITVETEGAEMQGQRIALNDIAVLKRDTAAMISIETSIDKEYVVTYQADGLIVATPTGSTAYSLSNGGPIVAPNADVLCLTPVAPHSMNIRPIVIDGNSEVALKVVSRSHNFLLAVDGMSVTLKEGTTVRIRKAAHSVKIVKLPNKHYYSTLREKMSWGLDNRA